ncbi:androgen-induced gene 1 protein-like isoform X2 [Liolophura sinensis]|uniref:androgen-induced gene 1 protein-like isoform X2 n=1 Tax=Liolophura sinensis TaxID=3198878 RepID=UPI0031593C16
MANMKSLALHLPAFAVLFYGLSWDVINVSIGWEGYGGKFKYLTFWDQCLQTFYFGLCVVNDLTGTNPGPGPAQRKKSSLKAFIDKFLASIGFPMGVFVVTTFWAIFYVDRELVFPRKLDGIIPPWLNHIMHTVPLPFLLLDKYMVYHEYPPRGKAMLTTIVFASVYQAWILWIAYYTNFWVYPVLEVLNNAQRCVFFLTLWAFLISIYLLGEGLSGFWWRYEKAKAVTSKKR